MGWTVYRQTNALNRSGELRLVCRHTQGDTHAQQTWNIKCKLNLPSVIPPNNILQCTDTYTNTQTATQRERERKPDEAWAPYALRPPFFPQHSNIGCSTLPSSAFVSAENNTYAMHQGVCKVLVDAGVRFQFASPSALSLFAGGPTDTHSVLHIDTRSQSAWNHVLLFSSIIFVDRRKIGLAFIRICYAIVCLFGRIKHLQGAYTTSCVLGVRKRGRKSDDGPILLYWRTSRLGWSLLPSSS